jgi:uncharacterized phage-associated protein
MVNIFDVAKHILHTIGREISPMKLHKLCYYSQAWHLAWYGILLFPEDFKKWDNGPVCEGLWNAKPVWFSISEDDIGEKYLSGQPLSLRETRTIDQRLEDYGMFNGAQLSEIVHREDRWKNAKKEEVISNKAMEECYKNLKDEKVASGKRKKR